MRLIGCFILVAGLVVCAGSVAGQESKITPPRLGIKTKQENQDKSPEERVLKVDAVSPGGLGQQLGLKADDILWSVQIDDREPARIRTPQELARSLTDIGKATLRPEKAAKVVLRIQTRDPQKRAMKEEAISGTVHRTEFVDRANGGTLYYFRHDKPESSPRPSPKKPG